MPRLLLTLALVLLTGCGAGVADWELAPSESGNEAADDGAGTKLGEWRAAITGIPQGEVVGAAHLDGALYVLVKGNGLFRLLDGQTQWSAANPPVSSASEVVTALALVDRALLVSTSDGATGSLYRLKFSDDPWTRLTGAPALPMNAIVKKGSAILVAVSGVNAGLYASTDGGESFSRRADATKAPFLSKPVRTFAAAAAAQRIFATGDIASGFGGLYASDDDGRTWSKLPLKGDVESISANGAVVLTSMTLEGELRSDNYGNTFRPVDVHGPSRAFFLSGQRAFAGSTGSVLVSDDAGLSWRPAEKEMPTTREVGLVYLAGSTLVAVAGGAVYLNDLE